MSNGNLVYRSLSGDYTKDTFAVSSNNTAWGTVTVNGAAPDNTHDYPQGTTLTLVATAVENAGVFVKWSNGATNATITVVTTGQPDAITAIFRAAE
jgi:hypothetical protein